MNAEGWRARLARALGVQAGTRIGVSYVFRITLAATASLVISRMLHIANPIWAVVSSVVVIMPDLARLGGQRRTARGGQPDRRQRGCGASRS